MGKPKRSAPSTRERNTIVLLEQARRSGQARQRRAARRGVSTGRIVTVGLLVGGLLGWVGPGLIDRLPTIGRQQVAAPRPADQLSAQFGFCHRGGGTNCVVDGDTFWFHGEKVRVMDIDAPETHGPRCPEEAALGARATRRLQDLMNAGPFSLESGDRDTDRYGRALRVVTRDGESIGEKLIAEGLAREWDGARHPWC